MRNRWHKSIALGTTLLLTAVLTAMTPAAVRADVVRWAPDLETAQAEASRQGRLVLIHFWAEDCPPCRRLEANVFSRPEVADAIAAKYVPVKVNAPQRRDLSRRFGVDRWPTDVVITPSGQKITSMVSPQDPQQYVNTFTQIASNMLPPPPATQTAGLAPQPSAEPYSNAYTGKDPLTAAMQPQPSRYGPTGNPALPDHGMAQHGTMGHQAPWNTSPAAGQNSPGYAAQAGGSIYGNGPSPAAPQGAGSAYGSRYSNGYATQGTHHDTPGFDYNPPAHASAANQNPGSRYQGGAYPENQYQTNQHLAAAPQPQQAPYQSRYANQAATEHPHSAVSDPMTPAQPTYNPYAQQAPARQDQTPLADRGAVAYGQPLAQPPAGAGPAADQRRQVWEWENGNGAPAVAAAGGAANYQGAHPPAQQTPSANAPSRYEPVAVAQHDPPVTPPAPQPEAGNPPMAMEGYCPVALNGPQPTWLKGDPRYGAVHRGRTYLFASADAQQQFLADPDRYAPALSGYDPVRFVEDRQVVDGNRAFGWFYKGRYYLFADEMGLRRFEKSPDMYHEVVQQAMQGGPGQQQAPAGSQYR